MCYHIRTVWLGCSCESTVIAKQCSGCYLYLNDLPCDNFCPRILHKMEWTTSVCPQCEPEDMKSFVGWLTIDLTHTKLLDMSCTPKILGPDDSKRALGPKNELLQQALRNHAIRSMSSGRRTARLNKN